MTSVPHSTGSTADAQLQLQTAAGETVRVSLGENHSVFAGTSQACGIVLAGAEIAPFHAVFSYINGQLFFQGCNPDCLAQIDGKLTAEETCLQHGVEVGIGDNRIVPLLSAPATTPASPAVEPAEPVDVPPAAAACDATACDAKEVAAEIRETSPNPAPACEDFSTAATTQELELLRSEVKFLQCELAQRNIQIAQSKASQPTATDPQPDHAETEKLVTRLEELLDELQSSDQHIRLLEDQVRAAHEANQAEYDERQQLEKWLGEVENRMSLREDETAAEMQRVVNQLAQEQQHRERAEQQLEKLMQAPAAEDSSAADLQELQRAQELLLQKSRQAETLAEENRELKHVLAQAQANDPTQELHNLKQSMAATELQISRERAAVAREKAQLEQLRGEMEHKHKQTPTSTQDPHLTAMRQHLREIHEEEKLQEMERKQNSLSGRIANLMARI